ncbi:hypothetical protein K9N68_35240 (plasmid) [Kovacikia minuta CCNUW1]|uniref:hypothetical protein n=1 Tax=Kovacikia minuta TaxID=2931930 RepID=UPI001CCEBCF9|nr:hypothetical protein [Kovacikia minuta]UBF30449.1 hypothetical protein K9N68_35240 [Kovacikia minuta CCNUW1]
MNKQVVNLTKVAIAQEVDEILDADPDALHRQAFSTPDSRQTLIMYVLSRASNYYVTLDECQDSLDDSLLDTLGQGRADREAIIRQGIEAWCRNYFQVSQQALDAAESGKVNVRISD